ncbi:hypothetical protein HDK90DRAFT_83834 [Phyllosticta capitalensis]|uniref:Uncharacterized protein n=1 Tax=Phyllosticta capitalensis TaxID=121624 RepID=A0ABR1YC82_9PEZI
MVILRAAVDSTRRATNKTACWIMMTEYLVYQFHMPICRRPDFVSPLLACLAWPGHEVTIVMLPLLNHFLVRRCSNRLTRSPALPVAVLLMIHLALHRSRTRAKPANHSAPPSNKLCTNKTQSAPLCHERVPSACSTYPWPLAPLIPRSSACSHQSPAARVQIAIFPSFSLAARSQPLQTKQTKHSKRPSATKRNTLDAGHS